MRSALKIKPQYFFLAAAIYFFCQLNRVTPPLQAPDEINHFYRALQIADGQLTTKKMDNRLGGFVPGAVREFVLPYALAASNIKYTLTSEIYYNSFKINYTERDSVFIDFPNTALHSPISYLPHAISIFVLKKFNCSIGEIYYGARYFVFCCWLMAMFYVIKMMPFGKWLITLLLLLPMNLYVTNSFSADTVTNIIALLFVSYVFYLATGGKLITNRQLVMLLMLLVSLAMAKFVYVGLAVLLFVLPFSVFKNKRAYFMTIGGLFLIVGLVSALWSHIVMSNYLPYANYNPSFRNFICLSNCANYYLQKAVILSDWTYFFKVIYRSIFDHPLTYLNGYIGIFGNSDIFLTKDIIYLSFTGIGLVALTEKNIIALTVFQKSIMGISALLAFIFLLLSQHLTWDCVGEGVVDLIQGRYLIPIIPLLLLALTNTKIKFEFLPIAIIISLLLFLYNYSTKEIYSRFYKDSFYSEQKFYCGAEKVNKWNYFLTSNKAFEIEAKKSQSDSIAHTGKYSAKLSSRNPYSMVLQLGNIGYGDLIEINAWQMGTGASIVIAGKGKNCKEFYFATNQVHYLNPKGWGKMLLLKSMDLKCDSVLATIYVWNPDTTKTVFIDDFTFSIKKFKGAYLDSVYLK